MHKALKKMDFDLVIVNTRFYPHSVYGAAFAKKKHTRCIFIEHGTGHMTVHNPVGDFVEHTVEHMLTFLDKRLCREYYGVSKACLEWLNHFKIRGKGTLYNAIDLEKIEKQKKQPVVSFRQKFGIAKEDVAISFTGRLLKEKGILTLAQAVQNLNRAGKRVYLLIAGDGDEAKSLEAFRSEFILPLGRLGFEEIIALLQETNIFCLPSDSEGFSTSILEAAACRNYVITTSRGGARELLLDDSYGMVLDKNDVETVQKALETAIENPGMREKGAALTYDCLSNHFTWDIVSDQVIDL